VEAAGLSAKIMRRLRLRNAAGEQLSVLIEADCGFKVHSATIRVAADRMAARAWRSTP
jgi:hypothetical protein